MEYNPHTTVERLLEILEEGYGSVNYPAANQILMLLAEDRAYWMGKTQAGVLEALKKETV